ncbi:hypothetical protein [Paenarthrobacter sp. NPDC090522]|uniref:hypothetical protein n=1 Tax=Paenarthrobacter sp. NPDC090522 TaxID=3364383 RepID=UPI0038132734
MSVLEFIEDPGSFITAGGSGGALLAQDSDPAKNGSIGERETFGRESGQVRQKRLDIFATQDKIQKVTILESFLLRAGVDHVTCSY